MSDLFDDLFKELVPSSLAPATGEYAGVEALLRQDDLFQQDVTITRWYGDGQPVKLRVRALDLDAQEQISADSLIKHPVTGLWVESNAAYCAATLREGVIVPRLNNEQAQALRKHNPRIIEALVRYIWLLSALDNERMEATASEQAVQAVQNAAVDTPGA